MYLTLHHVVITVSGGKELEETIDVLIGTTDAVTLWVPIDREESWRDKGLLQGHVDISYYRLERKRSISAPACIPPR